MDLGKKLKELRLSYNLTQTDLAKVLNTTQRRISYMESGKVEPDLSTLVALSNYFDVTTDYLIGIKDY